MFRRLPEAESRPVIPFTFEGRPAEGRAGDSVAAAVLALGELACRETAISRTPRGPYCLMGVCFDCLMEIDGVPNRQACMVPLAPGMRVARQRGPRQPWP
ncbi:MAG: (2Fe-2S)-binding protein [Rhodovarius sp.]|nr:(2Fe-2S)-binding protein [Rhodovarius sp.]MCX7932957.1 (2Fe-2S)-binding protein [Rhodovarius sp.]MDW8313995.1 (2Fe-2S)-binding protein [Rhodovarius sp.]